MTFEINEAKYNPLKLSVKKIIIPKGQEEIIDRLKGCISAALIGLSKEVIYTLLVLAKREWEKANMKPLNDFRFMHVNERIKAFDSMIKTFIVHLNSVLISPLEESQQAFLRKNALTNYKDILETEGYVVTYEI